MRCGSDCTCLHIIKLPTWEKRWLNTKKFK
jgi:hypothetical protein